MPQPPATLAGQLERRETELTNLTARFEDLRESIRTSRDRTVPDNVADELRRLSEGRSVAAAAVAMLRRESDDDDRLTAAANVFRSSDAPSPGLDTTTTRMREAYTAERATRGERSFFSDLYNAHRGDVGAAARIQQHDVEARAGASGSFAGLVPPDYLTEQAALVMRAGRPFASSITSLPLPEQGMSLIVPRSTTGASAAVQAAENTALSSTDEVWSNLTLPVCTIGGYAVLSRQSLERGDPGLDQLVMADLAGAYAVQVDLQSLSGSGSSGQVLGALNTAGIAQATAFTAAVTVATFWTKLAGMISAVTSARLLPPTHVAMTPRRYAWLCAQVDSAGRPLVLPSANGPQNSMGVSDGPLYGMGQATIAGLVIVVDANLPTSVGSGPEDQVVVYRAADLMIWENGDGTPTDLRFEQTYGNQLTTTLVAYGYIGFTAGRYPSAVGVIGGNSAAGFGLVAPTF